MKTYYKSYACLVCKHLLDYDEEGGGPGIWCSLENSKSIIKYSTEFKKFFRNPVSKENFYNPDKITCSYKKEKDDL